jgi:hypothetical protein
MRVLALVWLVWLGLSGCVVGRPTRVVLGSGRVMHLDLGVALLQQPLAFDEQQRVVDGWMEEIGAEDPWTRTWCEDVRGAQESLRNLHTIFLLSHCR